MLEARNNVASIVNVELLNAYWQIGRIIVENEQDSQARATYDKGLLNELSKELVGEFGRGFSVSNLQFMRRFYQEYPNQQMLSVKLRMRWKLLLKNGMESNNFKTINVSNLFLKIWKVN